MSSKSIKILSTQKHLNCTIKLTGSKSESNRALIMEALSEGAVQVLNVSEAADTVTLKNILHTDANQALSDQFREVNIGPAGTAMRFLSAYFTLQKGNVILTGSERMKQRPIGILVDALKSLGADIEYAEKEGFPPLKIRGPLKQKTDQIKIKGDISSQYISALLLIAPKLEQGLNLIIDGELTSKPYVEMTLAMMEQAGIRHSWTENEITILNQAYKKAEISVEPDWSAASYWYAIAALSEEASLFLPGLNGYSLQGDSKITEIMANFGITSQFKDGGVYLLKEAKKLERKIFDFKECPDLAQTVIVCCAARGHDALFTGLETLKIKETDRVNALQTELAKIGVKLIEKNQTYKLDCSELNLNRKISISTYDDHRMAMAFAPLALLIPELEIEDHLVVEKSYPDFWKHLELAGFGIEI
jgi:3-phosphoshikimate 1-carboxyvinyltransferase